MKTFATVLNLLMMIFILFLPLIVVFLYLRQKALDIRVKRLEQLLKDQYPQLEDPPQSQK